VTDRPAAWRRARLLALLAGAALLLHGLAGGARAEPVRTALVSGQGDGAWRFLSDLSELWRSRYDPTPEQLVVRRMPGALERLRLVARGRGDFAVVDVETAAAHLAEFPRLTAVAALWPDLLHAATRNPAVRELKLPISTELWAMDSADFAYDTLGELTQSDAAQTALLQRMPDDLLLDALDYAQAPILLFSAPTPLLQLVEAQRRDPRLRLLPIANRIVDEMKLAHPWLVTEKVGRATYPGLDRNLELPAVFQILVGRRDLPAPTVRKALDTIYNRSNAMALFDPLFGQTDGSMNAVFGKLMSFHPETARRFNFTPSVP
jgi:hypothetical protein